MGDGKLGAIQTVNDQLAKEREGNRSTAGIPPFALLLDEERGGEAEVTPSSCRRPTGAPAGRRKPQKCRVNVPVTRDGRPTSWSAGW
jgi:hypothetical protein